MEETKKVEAAEKEPKKRSNLLVRVATSVVLLPSVIDLLDRLWRCVGMGRIYRRRDVFGRARVHEDDEWSRVDEDARGKRGAFAHSLRSGISVCGRRSADRNVVRLVSDIG